MSSSRNTIGIPAPPRFTLEQMMAASPIECKSIQEYLELEQSTDLTEKVVVLKLREDPNFEEPCCNRPDCNLILAHGGYFTRGSPHGNKDLETTRDTDSTATRGCDICLMLAFLDQHRNLWWKQAALNSVTDMILAVYKEHFKDFQAKKGKIFPLEIDNEPFAVGGSIILKSPEEIEELYVRGRLKMLKWTEFGKSNFRNREWPAGVRP